MFQDRAWSLEESLVEVSTEQGIVFKDAAPACRTAPAHSKQVLHNMCLMNTCVNSDEEGSLFYSY